MTFAGSYAFETKAFIFFSVSEMKANICPFASDEHRLGKEEFPQYHPFN